MKSLKKFVLLLLFLSPLISFSQNYTISGTVKDASNGEYIIGANIYIKELGKGVATNVYGFYSITIPIGDYTLACSSIGFNGQEQRINLNADKSISIELQPFVFVTDIAEVVGTRSENTDDTQMGRVELDVEKIKSLPAFLGEVDILKTIQFLPGIQSAGEGNTGFYVRGGGPDQNLILLDNAVVYNASHLFGFFSVFNADAVKNVEVIKGGMPASYGGRLASVLDISLKEGNSKEFEYEGGIGLIASRFTAQGPIKKDKSSFIISGRRTYIDILAKPFINPESAFAGSGYYFYDLNMKVNYKITEKDQLFLSSYFGRDIFGFSSSDAGFSAEIPWGNATASLRWNRLINDKLFLNTIATFSDYRFSFIGSQEDFEFELNSGIRDWSIKSSLHYYPNLRHKIQGGVEYTYHTFSPSSVTARSGDVEFDTGEKVQILAHEVALYAQDEFDVSEKLRINGGLRFSLFDQVGPFTRYLENDSGNEFEAVQEPETVK
jgi:outer membrane cobalamin receptor